MKRVSRRAARRIAGRVGLLALTVSLLALVACGPPPAKVAGPGAFVTASPEEQAGRAAMDRVDLSLKLELQAFPIRLGERWGLRLVVEAVSEEEGEYIFAGHPAPRLSGRQMTLEGEELEIGERCTSQGEPTRLLQGAPHRFERVYGRGQDEALRPGERVTIDVAFCRVQPPTGPRVERLAVARVTMVAGPAGSRRLPEVTVIPARAAP